MLRAVPEQPTRVEIRAPRGARDGDVLTPRALRLVERLHDELESERRRLLAARRERQERLDAGELFDFLPATADLRQGEWSVPEPPADLRDRRVEITGPPDRKMVINALNSGASCFMADFEDATAPTWRNIVEGHANVLDAVRRTITFVAPDGRSYHLREDPATLLVRVRGLHLPERHLAWAREPVAGAFVDAALFLANCADELLALGSGPYLYLPKLESHREARLWNEALRLCEDELGLERGTVRVTVLIETLPAAFEMDEILWELRERALGLNAGRWDYIFSAIKRLRAHRWALLPDRSEVTMTVPFMRAYTELLVRTCHRRRAQAIGGMAAAIPSRTDAAARERALAAVAADKRREADDGFDGTWVAHPDTVATARAEFDRVLGERSDQRHRLREDVAVTAADLLALDRTPGERTWEGLVGAFEVALRYVATWLSGRGAVAIHGLMEDAATAEICRAQVWQWLRHRADLADGRTIDAALARGAFDDAYELARKGLEAAADWPALGRLGDAARLVRELVFAHELGEFLTLPGYELLASSP
jgi:malate synthase